MNTKQATSTDMVVEEWVRDYDGYNPTVKAEEYKALSGSGETLVKIICRATTTCPDYGDELRITETAHIGTSGNITWK